MIFKNFCPFPVNSLYLSLGSENPATIWFGTTWEKVEGRFLLGNSSSYSLGAIGGASTIKLTVDNLPSHTHSATTAAHTHTQPAHSHFIAYGPRAAGGNTAKNFLNNVARSDWPAMNSGASGGDTTGSASPTTSIGATGSGAAFSIMPPYLTINIWKRLS